MTRKYVICILLWTVLVTKASEIQLDDAEFLRKQEIVFQLLWNTKETPKNHPEVFERIKNYKIEDISNACENQTYGSRLEAHLKSGGLARDQVFSWLREDHVEEVSTMFAAFHSAKSFDEFVVMAAWLSPLANEMSWLHAFSIALAHRPDAANVRLPNLYEIVPHYFFNVDLLIQAYRAKTGQIPGVGEEYVIEANYSRSYDDPEKELSYFREDVGLNEFYFHWVASQPFWMDGERLGQQKRRARGELYYHTHKMLLARYKLELLSVGIDRELEDIDWEQPIATGYRPAMAHPNGQLFPPRQPATLVPSFEYKFLEEARHYESRISKAIDLGELVAAGGSRRTGEQGFNEFCNALEGNADSVNPKLYGSLDRTYRRILSFSSETPSALATSLASLRDPGFFRICKKIVDYGLRFKENLGPYSRDELSFEGLRLDYVRLPERLSTYMQPFESLFNHPRLVQLRGEQPNWQQQQPTVKLRQMRLQHKPFALEIGASSERPGPAVLRVFLGPENRKPLAHTFADYYELDRSIVQLKAGSNRLERSSRDWVSWSAEAPPSDSYLRSLGQALRTSDEQLTRQLARLRRGPPLRLLLPRGSRAGLQLRLLVCVHPLSGSSSQLQGLPLDGRPLGFPLDRPPPLYLDQLRNFMTKSVSVYHEQAGGVEQE